MKLTPGVTINSGDTVTRQTIYDLIANGTLSTVVETDFSSDTPLIVSQTDPPSNPRPGTIWFDKSEQLIKVWHDEVDDTGVSLWLAAGPDRFDMPMLTTEIMPFGAAVQLTGDGKKCQLPPSGDTLQGMGYSLAAWEALKVVGFNNNGQQMSAPTAASDAWIAVAVAGVPWTWYPINRNNGSGTWLSRGVSIYDFVGLISGATFADISGGFTAPRGETIEQTRGGLVYYQTIGTLTADRGPVIGVGYHRVVATGSNNSYARIVFQGPRFTRET